MYRNGAYFKGTTKSNWGILATPKWMDCMLSPTEWISFVCFVKCMLSRGVAQVQTSTKGQDETYAYKIRPFLTPGLYLAFWMSIVTSS